METKADPQRWKTLFDEIYLPTDTRPVRDREVTRREVNVTCQPLLPFIRSIES